MTATTRLTQKWQQQAFLTLRSSAGLSEKIPQIAPPDERAPQALTGAVPYPTAAKGWGLYLSQRDPGRLAVQAADIYLRALVPRCRPFRVRRPEAGPPRQ